jgi:ATP-dependent DNA helicase RecQ
MPSDCVLFYSWADVMSYDRFSDDGDVDANVAARQRTQVREMFRFASAAGCRHQAITRYLGEERGPCGSSCDVCAGGDVLAAAAEVAPARTRRAPGSSSGPSGVSTELDAKTAERFERLRKLRKRIADEKSVPAYVVFSDATLLAMAERRPASEAEMRGISGVGPKKLEQYGEAFLAELGAG